MVHVYFTAAGASGRVKGNMMGNISEVNYSTNYTTCTCLSHHL